MSTKKITLTVDRIVDYLEDPEVAELEFHSGHGEFYCQCPLKHSNELFNRELLGDFLFDCYLKIFPWAPEKLRRAIARKDKGTVTDDDLKTAIAIVYARVGLIYQQRGGHLGIATEEGTTTVLFARVVRKSYSPDLLQLEKGWETARQQKALEG